MSRADDVYSFEKHFLTALKTFMSEIPNCQVLTFFDPETKDLPRIEIGFTIGSNDPVDRTPNAPRYLRKFSAQVTIQMFSSGDLSERDAHYLRLGEIRTRMSYLDPRLKPPTLPYYQVQNVYEGGSSNGLSNAEDNEIQSVLNFTIDFQIAQEAFLSLYINSEGSRYVQPNGQGYYLQPTEN